MLSHFPPEFGFALPVIPVITGPTAVGKTELSFELADRLNAEILSFDSRQIYRGMDIGTAKPSAEELAAVPHHFIDEREIDDPISAGEFARIAWDRIESVRDRDKSVLAVGGSTLYLKALTEGLADIPPVPPGIRRRLNERLAAEGPARLFEELCEVDPVAAATMDETKSQRIVRALEVYRTTGRPLSHHQQHRIRPPYSFRVFVLMRDRKVLYSRIEDRVDAMLDAGLVEEVRSILDAGVPAYAPALRTIGYQEPIALLRGEISEDEMVGLLKRNTRRYAKRQLTWFRRFPSYTWIDAEQPTDQLKRIVLDGIGYSAGRLT